MIIRDDFDKSAVGSYGDAAPNPTTATIVETVIGEHGDSEFMQLIAHRDADHVWAVIDGMMETLKVMEPRLYAGVIRRINE